MLAIQIKRKAYNKKLYSRSLFYHKEIINSSETSTNHTFNWEIF